jgi:hypothetical protein
VHVIVAEACVVVRCSAGGHNGGELRMSELQWAAMVNAGQLGGLVEGELSRGDGDSRRYRCAYATAVSDEPCTTTRETLDGDSLASRQCTWPLAKPCFRRAGAADRRRGSVRTPQLKASGSEAAVWLMPLLELEWSRRRRRANEWPPNGLISNYSSDGKTYPPGDRMLRLRLLGRKPRHVYMQLFQARTR